MNPSSFNEFFYHLAPVAKNFTTGWAVLLVVNVKSRTVDNFPWGWNVLRKASWTEVFLFTGEWVGEDQMNRREGEKRKTQDADFPPFQCPSKVRENGWVLVFCHLSFLLFLIWPYIAFPQTIQGWDKQINIGNQQEQWTGEWKRER